MDANRKTWNQQQKALRQALSKPDDHQKAIELCLEQHAMVHSSQVAQSGLCSFADEVWQDLSEQAARRVPRKGEHSIVWIMWHLARIEDVVMNLLVAGSPQLLHQESWIERLQSPIQHTANAMDAQAVADLSAKVDVEALRAYRAAVGRRTRQTIGQLQADALKHKVEPARLGHIREQKAVLETAESILEY